MPKGRVLTLAEREAIAELHRAGASGREIAKKLERSKTVVLNFLRDPAQYGQIKRSGRKRALSSEDERRLYVALFRRPPPPAVAREGSEEQQRLAEALEMGLGAAAGLTTSKSAEQIKREFDLPLSVRRIQQLLSEWRKHARKQVDSHAVDGATQSGDVASPATEPAGGARKGPTAEESSPEAAVAGAQERQAASDAISSADAMLALPESRLDAAGPSDASKLGDEGCLSSLGIDDASAFPELQLSLPDDKLNGEASATVEAAPTPSPANAEPEQANATATAAHAPSSPTPLPAGALDPFTTDFTN